MYIAPNSTIRLLNGVPLDNGYRNTIHFNSQSAQQSYFLGKTKHTLTDYTYQQYNKPIMVGIKADNLYDCNYIMFQNTSFGNKWFYGFITSVTYKANETSLITFELDIMQTWYFDVTVNKCLVEREMSSTDVPGDNLVPENLELGDYITNNTYEPISFPTSVIIIACTFELDGSVAMGGYYSGLYSGLKFYVFNSANDASDFISSATEANLADGIVSVYMGYDDYLNDTGFPGSKSWTIPINTTLDGYTPRNKKLLTYPYNVLYVTNNIGNTADYHYEYFEQNNGDVELNVFATFNCNPEMTVFPVNYKGVLANYDEKLTLSGFPQLAYATDSFKAWLAQNATSTGLTALGSLLTTSVGVATANPVSATGGIASAAQLLSKVYVESTRPAHAHTGSGGSISAALGYLDFVAYAKSIRREFAEIIDGYFDVYGYATNRTKIPNRSLRPHWNYVKTVNSCVTGSIPADDLTSINSIYNKGITFWRNGDEVGNYNLNNALS